MIDKLSADTLSLHALNVGDGDNLIIELPQVPGETNRSYIMVDCFVADKTKDYLDKLGATGLKLVVATHPHKDHIFGLKKVMEKYPNSVEQFWDSGFRHTSSYWYDLIDYIKSREDIVFIRPTSGMAIYISGVEITVLAPSIYMRNRYDTFGVNINNSSIVMKLDYAGKTMILGADAQWDSWGKITEEFPHYEKTENPSQHIQLEETFNPLQCLIMKASHHGSKRGTSFEGIERLSPDHTIISCGDPSSHDFPHKLAVDVFGEIKSNVYYTHKGSVVLGINGSGQTVKIENREGKDDSVPAPSRI